MAARRREAVRVVSPYDEIETRPGNRWYERLRGLVGLTGVVVLSGVALAVMIALALLALAIFVATVFN